MAVKGSGSSHKWNMTEIEELIKKWWKKPRIEPQCVSELSWQELLDGEPEPHLRFSKL